ncbi:MAG: aminotransferase class V-fold PLP-dependent enzyme [Blastocatellia bacterium]|nr:aminotransferase class V-fold PLP-dependent enzyme [Blastocatellia bacterium]
MIYLDNASTSYPKPPIVRQRILETLETASANPGRSSHKLARTTQKLLDDTRYKLAKLVGAKNPDHVIFTFNTTDAINLALKGLLKAHDHVITSRLEHNSVLRPLRRLEKNGLISLTLVNFDSDGFVDTAEIERSIRPETRLIALTAASNVFGTIQPLKKVAEIAHSKKILFFVDAAQMLGAAAFSLSEIPVDILACGGHKALLGPTGTGFLYVNETVSLSCWREGGTGGDSLSELQPEKMPIHLEAGTPNTVGIAGLNAALDYLFEFGIKNIRQHEQVLTAKLLEKLSKNRRVKLYGTSDLDWRLGVVSFLIQGYQSDEVASILDESFDIAVRSGLHCAPLVHKALGTDKEGLVRVSLGPFTTAEDIDILVEAVKEISLSSF